MVKDKAWEGFYLMLAGGPYLWQRANAMTTLIAASVGAAVIVNQVAFFHVHI